MYHFIMDSKIIKRYEYNFVNIKNKYTYPKFLSNSSVLLLAMMSEFSIEVILLFTMFHLQSRLLIPILIIITRKRNDQASFS